MHFFGPKDVIYVVIIETAGAVSFKCQNEKLGRERDRERER